MTRLQELFIKNLRFFRKKQGISQLAFSEKIAVSPNYFNAVENGKNFPSPELIQNISDSLGVLPYQLFMEYPMEEPNNAEMETLVRELSDLRQKFIQEIDGVIAKYCPKQTDHSPNTGSRTGHGYYGS
jgi:transcriptional regulator with XRE-family HTH domain